MKIKPIAVTDYIKIRNERQELVNDFIDKFLEISYKLEEHKSFERDLSDMQHFNFTLPECLAESRYMEGKSFGYESAPILGWGFVDNMIEEAFKHNINGMFLKVEHILNNWKKFHKLNDSPWCNIKIKYKNKIPVSFVMIDHHGEKVNVTVNYSDGGYITNLSTQVVKGRGKLGFLIEYELDKDHRHFIPDAERGYEIIKNKHVLIEARYEINKFFQNLEDILIEIKETLED